MLFRSCFVKYIITKHHLKSSKLKKGNQVEVEYTLKTLDGTVLGKPKEKVRFELGVNPPQVISGWEQVLPKLRVGESAKIWIPSSSAYSIFGNGKSIKPNTILFYEITVTDVFVSAKK